MSTITEKLAELESQLVDTVKSAQEPVVEGVTRVVSFVDAKLPELPTVAVLDRLPAADELIDQQFAFAGKLLDAQHEFISAIVAALAPLTSQLRPAAPVKSTKAKTTKAAA